MVRKQNFNFETKKFSENLKSSSENYLWQYFDLNDTYQ